jgi:uncharacterized NAD-dependent epimerase/dehydratase family protein
MIQPNKKLAIYMEGALETENGKMGFGVMRYSPNPITCAIDTRFAGQTVRQAVGQPFDYPVVANVEEAQALGSEVFVLGTAPSGGKFPDSWDEPVITALKYGMSLINGLHDDLNARFGALLDRTNPDQVIWDVRKPLKSYAIASARAAQLKNTRVLLVGTDMAVGKMTTGLELYRWFKAQGYTTDFLATGQIGITVSGKGIPLDAIKVDQACGAVEDLVMSANGRDFVFIEGQGSLLHPGSTATLPLMRGSCATHLILCHRARMNTLFDHPNIKIPPLKEFIALNEAVASACGSLTPAKCVGVALNTFGMSDGEAIQRIDLVENETGLATTDVIRFGPAKLANALLQHR